jgi:peptidoglycan/xylan/chitin deacetylase (PgdA/CDA1 family)
MYWLGILQLWQHIALRRKAVVLMYHRVLTHEERSRAGSHPAVIVDQRTFAKHMEVVKRRFHVLSVDEFAKCVEQRTPFPSSSCLITFDDGWRDNFTNALPILEKYGLPAVVFLPVNYIGQARVFWRESFTHLLLAAIERGRRDAVVRDRLRQLLQPVGIEHVLDLTDDDPREAVSYAIGNQRRWPKTVVEPLLTLLSAELKIPITAFADTDGFIDWEQVDAMSRRGIAFGAHGVEHLLLTHVSANEADREIRLSRDAVAERVRPKVLTFSYPNGFLTDAIANQVKAAGYRLGFTTRRRPVSASDDPLTIGRINIFEDGTTSTPMFLARVLGLW